MKIRNSITSAVAALLLTSCQSAPAFTPQDEAAIKAMFDSTPGYFVKGTFEPWADQFAANGTLHPDNAAAATGRAAMLAWAKAFPPLEQASFSNVKIVGEGDMAWGTSNYLIKIKGGPEDKGKQLVVLHRTGAKWEIVAVSFNSDLPLPAPAPAKAGAKK